MNHQRVQQLGNRPQVPNFDPMPQSSTMGYIPAPPGFAGNFFPVHPGLGAGQMTHHGHAMPPYGHYMGSHVNTWQSSDPHYHSMFSQFHQHAAADQFEAQFQPEGRGAIWPTPLPPPAPATLQVVCPSFLSIAPSSSSHTQNTLSPSLPWAANAQVAD